TAFPNVAFNNPPTLGPLTIAILSVALPIKLESAIIATAHNKNIGMSDQLKIVPIKIKGRPITNINRKIRFIVSPLSNFAYYDPFPYCEIENSLRKMFSYESLLSIALSVQNI